MRLALTHPRLASLTPSVMVGAAVAQEGPYIMAAPTPSRPRARHANPHPVRVCTDQLDVFEPFDFHDDGTLEPRQADRARAAIDACHGCPLLHQCQQDVATALTSTDTGFPPQSVVQAGVLFDPQSRRYTPPAIDPAPDMLPMPVTTAATINGRATWSPPAPTRRINWRAVRTALSDATCDHTVTIHYVLCNGGDPAAEPRTVLSAADELATIHRGLETGLSVWKLSVLLRTRWDRVDRLIRHHGLGGPNPDFEVDDPHPARPRTRRRTRRRAPRRAPVIT